MFVGEQHGKAEEAMNLYVSVFDDSRVLDVERFAAEDDDSGIKLASFELAGRRFLAMDSGSAHEFRFTPAMSMFVDCDSEAQLDGAFEALSAGAKILMPLDAYPFSPRFAWLEDRFGVSWQLSLLDRGDQPG